MRKLLFFLLRPYQDALAHFRSRYSVSFTEGLSPYLDFGVFVCQVSIFNRLQIYTLKLYNPYSGMSGMFIVNRIAILL